MRSNRGNKNPLMSASWAMVMGATIKDEMFRSTAWAAVAGARAHWRAKYPQASEDELKEIMAGPERAAVRSYYESLPVEILDCIRAAAGLDMGNEVIDELVAEGKAVVTERDEGGKRLVSPATGTMAAFERLVLRRVAKKVRDL
jgi:hypothetical protein